VDVGCGGNKRGKRKLKVDRSLNESNCKAPRKIAREEEKQTGKKSL
jgi:hypothetical protein